MSNEISHQKIYKLSEIVEFIGKKISVSELTTDQYISTENMLPNRGGVVEATALPETSRVNQFEIGDTLFSNIRTYFRKVWQAEFDGGASPDVLIFRSRDKQILDPSYLYYLISDEKFIEYSNLTSKGAKMPRGDKAALMLFQTALPSLDEQKKIAGHLKTLDEKIRLNTQTNQTLEHIAQALFKSWFIDFDPVKAKAAVLAEGGSPRAAERAAMRAISGKNDAELDEMQQTQAEAYRQLATTAALFPYEMEDSELGAIPKGWQITDLGSVSICFDNQRIPLSKRQREKKKGNIPYYGATSVMDYVNEAIFDGIYLLVGEDGSVIQKDGSPFLQYIWGQSWINNHAHVLQGRGSVSTEHLMLFLSCTNISSYITGAVQLKLNQKNMNRIPFIKGTDDLNYDFHKKISFFYEKIRCNSKENNFLIEVRDTLLPQLLSDSLSLPDEAV